MFVPEKPFDRKKRIERGFSLDKPRMPCYPWPVWLGIVALVIILLECFSIGLAIA